MKNFDTKNNKKNVNTKDKVKLSINKVNLAKKETLNKFKSYIAQDFINNIENLKTKFVLLNSASLNMNRFTNYISKDKIINLEYNFNLKSEINQNSNFNNSTLTFENLLKNLNLSKTELKNLNLNMTNLFKQDLNNNKLKKVKSTENITLTSNPKMADNGLFMSLSTTNDFYFYLINALNYIYNKKRRNLIASNQKLNSNKELETNITLKLRNYINLLTKYNYNLSTSHYKFFQFNKYNKYLFKMEKAAELLKLDFLTKGCLISKPIFNLVYPYETNESKLSIINNNNLKFNNKNLNKPKIIIHLFYFVKKKGVSIDNYITKNNNNITLNYQHKFANLCDYLSKLFGTEIELELTRLYQPYQDSNILVQYLNSKSYNVKFALIVSRLFKKIKIYKRKNSFNLLSIQEIKNQKNNSPILLNEPVSFPSGISGINIKLAGRPMKERIVPRYTVKRAQRGNFNKLNTKMIEKSMFTDKTKKGSFNFTVKLSHIFK